MVLMPPHPHPHQLISCATRRAYNPVCVPTHTRLVPCMACCWGCAMSQTSTLGFLHGCDAGLHSVVLRALCCPERLCWTLPPHYPLQSNASPTSSDWYPAPLRPPSSVPLPPPSVPLPPTPSSSSLLRPSSSLLFLSPPSLFLPRRSPHFSSPRDSTPRTTWPTAWSSSAETSKCRGLDYHVRIRKNAVRA